MKKRRVREIMMLVITLLLVLLLTGCSKNVGKLYKVVDIDNNLSIKTTLDKHPEKQIKVFKSKEELDGYLNNNEIFKETKTKEFNEFLKIFDEDFFKKNNLIYTVAKLSGELRFYKYESYIEDDNLVIIAKWTSKSPWVSANISLDFRFLSVKKDLEFKHIIFKSPQKDDFKIDIKN